MVHVIEKNKRRAFYSLSAFRNIEEIIKLEAIADEPLPLANISYFGGAFPICFDEEAYTLLKVSLDSFGTVKRAIIKGYKGNYYIFWPSKVIDCLDLEKSTIDISPTGYKRLVKPVFNHTLLTKGLMFIVPQFMTSDLFVTEDVAEKILNSDLTGHILVDASIPRAR